MLLVCDQNCTINIIEYCGGLLDVTVHSSRSQRTYCYCNKTSRTNILSKHTFNPSAYLMSMENGTKVQARRNDNFQEENDVFKLIFYSSTWIFYHSFLLFIFYWKTFFCKWDSDDISFTMQHHNIVIIIKFKTTFRLDKTKIFTTVNVFYSNVSLCFMSVR